MEKDDRGEAFKKRHIILLQSHTNHKQYSTSGLNLLFGKTEGFSQAQAAWRFYNNDNVNIDSLNNPLMDEAFKLIEDGCDEYLLAIHDWSHLDYKNQEKKKECIQTRHSKNQKRYSIGYDLQSTLAISDKEGRPIVPLVQNLKTSKHTYSTYKEDIDQNATHLEELQLRARYIRNIQSIKKHIVDIIDREADSIALMRYYSAHHYSFLIRGNDRSKVHYRGEDISQKELARRMDRGEYVKKISYKNKEVYIYVNEVDILITRDTYQRTRNADGTLKRKRVKGEAIPIRFIVERLIDKEGEVVASWLLLSNVPNSVSSERIALWYYWRWKIESYFKLLKSSGFNLEQWQQKDPLALFKRLLIASYACVLVWKIEQDNTQRMQKIKKILIKLSGRLIERGKASTSSALLAGLWNYFSAMDLLEMYELDELLSIRDELKDVMGLRV
jgi:hypothetical protein